MYANDKRPFNLRKIIHIAIIALAVFCILFPAALNAASLYITPSSGTYVVGDTITIDVLVTTEEASNAVSGRIEIPETLQPVSVTKGSIVDLWLIDPAVIQSGDAVVFEGLLLDTNFSGTGKVLTLYVKVLSPGESNISFPEGLVLANDGFGTNIADSLRGATLSLLPAQEGREPIVPLAEEPAPPSSLLADSPTERLFAPLVVDYTERLLTLGEFRVTGATYPDARVRVFLQGEGGELEDYQTVSDAGGNFIFRYKIAQDRQQLLPANVFTAAWQLFSPEIYQFWLRTEKDGSESDATRVFEVSVGGFSASTLFSSSASIIIMLIVTLLLLFLCTLIGLYGWKYLRLIRKRLYATKPRTRASSRKRSR